MRYLALIARFQAHPEVALGREPPTNAVQYYALLARIDG